MFLPALRSLNFMSDCIRVYAVFNSKKSGVISHYCTQFTVLILSQMLLFFFKFIRFSCFFHSYVLLDIVACDYKNAVNRFGITYVLYSPVFSTRLYIRTLSDIFLFIKSVGVLFFSAIWLEREVFDMFGLFFLGNEDLRRILMDYGFDGFPLQKDFPLIGFIEKQYMLSEDIIISRHVVFTQEFRFTL